MSNGSLMSNIHKYEVLETKVQLPDSGFNSYINNDYFKCTILNEFIKSLSNQMFAMRPRPY